jgi:hypothetical protein
VNDAPRRAMNDMRHSLIAVAIGVCLPACSASHDAAPRADSTRSAAAMRDTPPTPPAPVVHTPITLDTASSFVLELWPLALPPSRQMEETRRIVEHLQADLTLVPGFESATLLASGDGEGLLLVATWHDAAAADRADHALAGWLRAETDSLIRRRHTGSATTRVHVRRTVGTPPTLSDAAMLQFTRYALKPGHSFGALAALADSNLAMRVLQDTSAQGGATIVAADSGALYMLLQARTATALDPTLHSTGPLPFWAPFANREEQLLAVIAIVYHR